MNILLMKKDKINIRYYIKYIFLFALAINFLVDFAIPENLIAKAKPKPVKTKLKVSKSTKKAKTNQSATKKKKRKKRRIRARSVSVPVKFCNVLYDSTLSEGIVYKKYEIGNSKLRHIVNVIEADLSDPYISPEIILANEHVGELERLHEMLAKFNFGNKKEAMGAVNGSFWRAYNNFPIGPTTIKGEVVEMPTHKQWSSTFIDKNNSIYIDNFYLNASISDKKKELFEIDYVNRRKDSASIVLYNQFCGDTIPYVRKRNYQKELEEARKNALQDTIYNDSTDIEFDEEKFKAELISNERLSLREFSLWKVSLKYLNSPAINKDIACIVNSIDTGAVAVPHHGCIISLGSAVPKSKFPKIGDTLYLKFSTNVYDTTEFVYSVSATPRLVRNGKTVNDAQQEGSHGRRFILCNLPRTAIGTDKTRKKLFLAAVDVGNGMSHSIGASLAQLANIMKLIGCYNAMNLDGGGSSMMVIGSRNISRKNPETSRKIAVGIGVSRRNF